MTVRRGMSETERDARSLRSFRHSVFPSHITYLRSYFVPSVVTPPVPLRSITRPKVEWVNGVKEVTRVRACSHRSSVQPLPLVVASHSGPLPPPSSRLRLAYGGDDEGDRGTREKHRRQEAETAEEPHGRRWNVK